MNAIKGYSNKWVGIVENKVLVSSDNFNSLVKKLKEKGLLEQAVVTHVSGNYVVL